MLIQNGQPKKPNANQKTPMRTDSLFADIVTRLAAHPENVATEALAYILRRYPAVWQPLRKWLALTQIELPDRLLFSTQVTDQGDDAIPDLVGASPETGKPIFVIESKFWAGLTPHQPTTYLRRLVAGTPGIVLAISPKKRFETLWPKLLRACDEGQIAYGAASPVVSGLRFVSVGPSHALVLTTWEAILGIMNSDAAARSDVELAGDVEQLNGLAERMDSSAFLPLVPGDLSRQFGLRAVQYADMVESIVKVLRRDHGADITGLSAGRTLYSIGRYFKLQHLGLFLTFAADIWAKFGETPLWLRVKYRSGEPGQDALWPTPPWLREALIDAFPGDPDRIRQTTDGLYVSIELKTYADQETVIAHAVEQILHVLRSTAVGSTSHEK